jgi:hypothetical protein
LEGALPMSEMVMIGPGMVTKKTLQFPSKAVSCAAANGNMLRETSMVMYPPNITKARSAMLMNKSHR